MHYQFQPPTAEESQEWADQTAEDDEPIAEKKRVCRLVLVIPKVAYFVKPCEPKETERKKFVLRGDDGSKLVVREYFEHVECSGCLSLDCDHARAMAACGLISSFDS